MPLPLLLESACAKRKAAHGNIVSYSPKVFIPLTRLCRDVCSYCTFARQPRELPAAYLKPHEVLAIARKGVNWLQRGPLHLGRAARASLRYRAQRVGRPRPRDTITYLATMADLIRRGKRGCWFMPIREPLTSHELNTLRRVSVSQGLMLESTAARLCDKGGPHYGCPDKRPLVRISTLATAGELAIPFTTGILIGIGGRSGGASRRC